MICALITIDFFNKIKDKQFKNECFKNIHRTIYMYIFKKLILFLLFQIYTDLCLNWTLARELKNL